MEQIFVSINGDDSRSGLTREEAIKSWKRLMQLSKGNAEWILWKARSQTIVSRKKRSARPQSEWRRERTEPKQLPLSPRLYVFAAL